jgi:hypothetical protein
LREQSRRLSLCRLTFYRLGERGEAVLNGGFVREAILPARDAGSQLSLWRETVVLDINRVMHPVADALRDARRSGAEGAVEAGQRLGWARRGAAAP